MVFFAFTDTYLSIPRRSFLSYSLCLRWFCHIQCSLNSHTTSDCLSLDSLELIEILSPPGPIPTNSFIIDFTLQAANPFRDRILSELEGIIYKRYFAGQNLQTFLWSCFFMFPVNNGLLYNKCKFCILFLQHKYRLIFLGNRRGAIRVKS